MNAFAVAVATVVNTLILAVVVRRLLGVPVGWPRTLLLSLLVLSAASPLITSTLTLAGLGTQAQAQANPGATVAVVGLLVAWLIAIEVSVLAIGEAVLPTGSLPRVLDLLRGIPGWLRRTRRYLSILWIAFTTGLTPYLSRSRVDQQVQTRDAAVALREALTRAGVTFVKLGQMVSTRPDLVPPRFIAELSTLHSQVEPEPWSAVEQTLNSELGAIPFSQIEQTPLASASVGQVYRAVLPTAQQTDQPTTVVVKVQRSEAESLVRADLDIITRLAALTEARAGWARRMGTVSLAEGFARSLDEELDYRVELANLAAMRGNDLVVVPRGFAEYSSRRVLTMELLDGLPVSRAGEQLSQLPADRRTQLATALLDVVLRQVLVDGIFHADLHGGNVLLLADGRLALLDFGAVGRLDRSSRNALALMLLGVDRQDATVTTRALLELLDAPATLDRERLRREVSDLVMRVGTLPMDELFTQLFATVMGHGLAVPPMIAAAFRALGALEGTLSLIDPSMQLLPTARERAATVLGGDLSPEALLQRGKSELALAVPLLQSLPDRVDGLLSRWEQGDRRPASVAPPGWVQSLVMAILTAIAAACGTALVLHSGGPTVVPGLPLTVYLGLVLLLFGYVLGSRLVVAAFRHR